MTTAPARAVASVGPATAVALLVGVLLLVQCASLPPLAWLWGLLLAALLLWVWPRTWARVPGALLVGFALAGLHGQWAMDLRLPTALEGEDLPVEVRVLGLPTPGEHALRFEAHVQTVHDPRAAALVGQRIRLSWYGAAPAVAPGERWQLTVRLKRPRGVLNPGGQDAERRALAQRLAATGYVRDGGARRLGEARGLDHWRAQVAERIDGIGLPASRFVRALALGDTRALGDADWDVLRATGLTHLIAISGFHVGLVAGFGALLVSGLFRLRPAWALRIPLPQAAALGALLAGLGYAAVAGFELPTVRTVLMIAAALSGRLLRRPAPAAQAFALALVAVLVVDPLAVLAPGFWLSFAGVAWLLWCLPRGAEQGPVRALLGAQGVATLGLLPLTVWFFGEASIAGPLVNLLGIPWISLVVVPLALVGLLLDAVWPTGAVALWQFSAWAMALPWPGLEAIADLRGALVYLPAASLPALMLALLGAFWLLLPRGIPGKPLALVLLLPLLWPRSDALPDGAFELVALDVGQGLSVLVRTRDHALLVDAGPAWDNGPDMGDIAVVPTLRALGVTRLDTLLLSHGDSDHAGGAAAVQRAFAPSRVLAPDALGHAGAEGCEAGSSWRWNGVVFRLLHPPPHFPYLRNESSCVLRIEGAGGTALLPGDIGETIEARLVREQADALRADLLLVPHHGSRSSSSPAFVAAVSPSLALVSSGHRNRFGLPREDVLARYVEAGSTLFDTARHGALRVRVEADGVGPVAAWRLPRRRFWHEP